MNRLLILSLTVLAIPALASYTYTQQEIDEIQSDFRHIEENYRDGYCHDLLNNNTQSTAEKRFMALMAMEEILRVPYNGTSAATVWIGDFSTFRIGRKISKHFIEIMETSNNPDAAKFLYDDMIAISNEIEKIEKAEVQKRLASVKSSDAYLKKVASIKLSTLEPVALRTKDEALKELRKLEEEERAKASVERDIDIIMCRIYQIVMDERSEAAIEFKGYVRSLNQRILGNYYKEAMDELNR